MTASGSMTDVHAGVTDFLIREAEVLDEQDYTTWLAEYVCADISYQMPVQVTRERNAALGTVSQMMHIDDDWNSLNLRARRLQTEFAWAEDPPSRIRHHLSNIRVVSHDGGPDVTVRSALLLFRSRGDQARYDLLSAGRDDVLRYTDDGWRLARRLVTIDQSVIMTHNLAFLF